MQPTASYNTDTSDIDSLLFSSENINDLKATLTGAAATVRGTVVGKQTIGAIAAAAKGGGNTGTGTCTALSVQKNTQVGIYKAVCVLAPAANQATFNLYDPNGKLIDYKALNGAGATAIFANDQIHATITDAGTDFVVGDEFDITVSAGSGKYVTSVANATDGSQFPSAVTALDADATAADVDVLLYTAGHFVASALTYDASFASVAALQAALPHSIQVHLDGPV